MVSIPRLSRAISARTWGWDPLVQTAFFFSEPLSSLPTSKRLTSEAEGKSWLDGVVSVYAQRSGISLVAPGAGGAAGGGGGGATINSKEFLKFQADQQKFAAQHVELYMRYLGRDSRAGEAAFDQEKVLQAKLDSINRKHGDTYIEGIQPCSTFLCEGC